MNVIRAIKEDLDTKDLCLPVPEPTVQDRCDHADCSAQAYVVTSVLRQMDPADGGEPILAHLGDLHWCGHHYAKHEAAITAGGHLAFDYRDRLLARSTNSI